MKEDNIAIDVDYLSEDTTKFADFLFLVSVRFYSELENWLVKNRPTEAGKIIERYQELMILTQQTRSKRQIVVRPTEFLKAEQQHPTKE
jgi:hypothetical protein